MTNNIFFGDMCLEKYTLEIRESGHLCTDLARANESHKTSPREFGVPENEERIFGAMK